MRTLNVVGYFFELVPVDLGDFGFELVVRGFVALFVRGLAVGAAVVREVRDPANFVKVFPCPRADRGPVFFFDGDCDTRFMLTPMSLIGEPKRQMSNRRYI